MRQRTKKALRGLGCKPPNPPRKRKRQEPKKLSLQYMNKKQASWKILTRYNEHTWRQLNTVFPYLIPAEDSLNTTREKKQEGHLPLAQIQAEGP